MNLLGKRCLLIMLAPLWLSGCATVKNDAIEESRYQYDRTFTLDDIAPVIPAFVKLPYAQCSKTRLLSVPFVVADIDGPRDERVYYIKGKPCLVSH